MLVEVVRLTKPEVAEEAVPKIKVIGNLLTSLTEEEIITLCEKHITPSMSSERTPTTTNEGYRYV